MSQEQPPPSDAAPPPLTFEPGADLDASAERAANFLWDSGLDKTMAGEASDPYEEDADIHIGYGRDATGVEYANRALTEPWYEITDELIDNNSDYLYETRQATMDTVIEREIGSRGSLSDAWDAILERLGEAAEAGGQDFDEDEFAEQVTEKIRDLARDDGVDCLHEISHRLRGSCGGSWSYSFNLCDGSPGPWLPDLDDASAAADCAHLLSLLNIHPLDFARALATHVEAALERPDCWDEASLDEEGGAQAATATARQLLDEFMGGCESQPDPALWAGGMGQLASAFAHSAWSLPRSGSAPAASAADVVERLAAARGKAEGELIFDAEGSELQEHATLLDRFGEESPVCGEMLACSSASLRGADFYLEGEAVPLAGPVCILVEEARLQAESSGDDAFEPCMSARRQAAARAQSLSWDLKPEADGSSGPLGQRAAKLCAEIARDEPAAFEQAEASARARGHVDEQKLLAARALVDSERAAIAERLAKRGKSPAAAEPAPSVEDFDIRAGALAHAPWRHALPSDLARQKDSLGNTLAHKAVACMDPLLLRFALLSAPESADARNLAGRSPLDLVHAVVRPTVFISLARELLKARPDLADAHAGTNGRSLVELAANRGHGSADLIGLAGAGCSLGALSRDGSAWWTHWSHKPADFLRKELPAMIEAGWNVNSRDGSGRCIAHRVGRLDAALVLLGLGADFSIKDDDGVGGGARLRPEEFAELERGILAQAPEPERPRARAKAL